MNCVFLYASPLSLENLCSQSDNCNLNILRELPHLTQISIHQWSSSSQDPESPYSSSKRSQHYHDSRRNLIHGSQSRGFTLRFRNNITLYNVQSLSATAHTLELALVDYVYGNGTTMGSLICFDYAAVNDTAPSVVAPSASGAGGPTPTLLPPRCPRRAEADPRSLRVQRWGLSLGVRLGESWL